MKTETKKRTYYCWAEHTAGKSIGHSCSTGSFSDPSDDWILEVTAENQDEAYVLAGKQFEAHVKDWEENNREACCCGKYSGSLWNSWWDSVAVITSLKPYPEYWNDDDDIDAA
jgi:hypothetical protein